MSLEELGMDVETWYDEQRDIVHVKVRRRADGKKFGLVVSVDPFEMEELPPGAEYPRYSTVSVNESIRDLTQLAETQPKMIQLREVIDGISERITKTLSLLSSAQFASEQWQKDKQEE